MGYNTELYMHELDKKAFDALNAFPTDDSKETASNIEGFLQSLQISY